MPQPVSTHTPGPLRRLRAAFVAERVDPRLLWYAASEGTSMWIRHLEEHLGDHLDDRHRARLLLAEAWSTLCRRRAAALPGALAETLRAAPPAELRALFEALYPGPVSRSIRWTLHPLTPEAPARAVSLRAWRRFTRLDPEARWLEVSTHLGELAIVLGELLPAAGVPRALGWLGEVSHRFGREVGELARETFTLPEGPEAAIETLRMGELLFRVNPEHLSAAEGDGGFIEGNACLWYQRPGWGPKHCGILGRFQAGVSEVFGLRYNLTRTIPKNGGGICRIDLTPLPAVASPTPRAEAPTPRWSPPTRLAAGPERQARLDALAATRDPAAGFFGPETLLWRGTREACLLLGGGRAALMQLAHPAVAHAIRDHSVVHADMWGRFARTMLSAYGVLFGSVEEALAISEKVHGVHAAIAGALDDVPGHAPGRYHALDPEATFWVGATLFETSMVFYERLVHPFEPSERDRLVREAGPFWALFGVPLEACPTTWRDLKGYVDRRVEELAPQIGPTARSQAHQLFAPRGAGRLQGAFDATRDLVAFTLHPPLREAFDLPLTATARMRTRGALFAAERLLPHLPGWLRYVPAYTRARWRVGPLRDGWGGA